MVSYNMLDTHISYDLGISLPLCSAVSADDNEYAANND